MMLTLVVIGLAVGFYGGIIIAAHRCKVEPLELTEDDKVS
jgi:hypothetical protein